ncbi:MAG: hypothetical protein AAB975_03110, partial [Patescibacteria group bacterium]
EFIRIIDDSGLANTVRGIEIQSGSGTTTAGVNAGLRSTGKTFGVQGITTATGAGDLIPAGIYAESTSSTTGQALRVYTGTTTTADLAVFYQEGTQKFQGTGLKMNFGAGAGAFEGAFLNLQINGVTRLMATTTGSIGIGTSTPFYATSTQSAAATHRGIHIESGAMMTGKYHPMLLLQTSDGSGNAGEKWYITAQNSVTTSGAADFDFGVDLAGNIYSDGASITTPADYAEWFPAVNDRANLEAGDLVATDGSSLVSMVKKSTGKPYDPHVIGIVSTKPGFIAGSGGVEESHDGDVMVALAGRVPLKVSTEGGIIRVGDRLTSSSLPGVAMKATSTGMTVGVALEAFDGIDYLSEGTIGVETNKITAETIATTTKKVLQDTRYYGGELDPSRPLGSLEEVMVQQPVAVNIITWDAPKKRVAEEQPIGDKTVKVGKVLVFVNLAWAGLDAGTAQLARTSVSAVEPTNAWSVDRNSGKINVGFFGDINSQGNAILDVGKITGYLGKWNINEEGILTIPEVQAKRGIFEDSLEVGKEAKPAGITIYDTATAAPFCIQIVNGAMQSVAGKCNVSTSMPTNFESSPSPSPSPFAPEPSLTPPAFSEASSSSPVIDVSSTNNSVDSNNTIASSSDAASAP